MARSALTPKVRRELRDKIKQQRDPEGHLALREWQGELAQGLAEANYIDGLAGSEVKLSWRDAEVLRLIDFPAWTSIHISNYRITRGPKWEMWQKTVPVVRWKRQKHETGVDVAFASFMPWLRKFMMPSLLIEHMPAEGQPFDEGWTLSLYGVAAEIRRYYGGGFSNMPYYQASYKTHADNAPTVSSYLYGLEANKTAIHWCRLVLHEAYWDRVNNGLPWGVAQTEVADAQPPN